MDSSRAEDFFSFLFLSFASRVALTFSIYQTFSPLFVDRDYYGWRISTIGTFSFSHLSRLIKLLLL